MARPPNNPDPDWQLPVDPSAGQLPADDEPEETATDRVAAMLDLVDGDDRAILKLSRELPNGKREWCADYKVADFEAGGMELIRREWGPGTYWCMLYGSQPGTKRFVIRTRMQITIAKRLNEDTPPTQAPTEVARVLSAMQEQNRMILDALTQRSAAPAVDPTQQLVTMMSLMKSAREAFGLDHAPAPAQKSSIAEMLEGIRMLREAKEELDGNGGKRDDDPMSMLPGIIDLVKGAQQNQASQTVMPVALPASVATAPIVEQPLPTPEAEPAQPEGESNVMGLILLKGYLMSLLTMAKANMPTDQAAQFVADKLPEDLIDLIELPNWFEVLVNVAPEVAPHQAWLTEVREKAMPLLFEPDPPTQ